jgi:hypothetical protein
VCGHKGYGFGRGALGCHREVTFVFPVFIVDYDNHLSLAYGLDSIFNGSKGAGQKKSLCLTFSDRECQK